MLTHPNPMINQGKGKWIDTRLKSVGVSPVSGVGDRWKVTKRVGGRTLTISVHITEEMAVVRAQELANRSWRDSLPPVPRNKSNNHVLAGLELYVKADKIQRMTKILARSIERANTGRNDEAKQLAAQLMTLVSDQFQLTEES